MALSRLLSVHRSSPPLADRWLEGGGGVPLALAAYPPAGLDLFADPAASLWWIWA